MAAQTDNIYKLDAKVITGLEHNPKVWISEGSSRFCTNWKNRQITWAELLKRLENATMTQETQSEYMRMAKTDQDKIKDVGGFVGGTLKSGRRKTDTVQSRSLITFDLDFAPTDFVETRLISISRTARDTDSSLRWTETWIRKSMRRS